VAEYQPFIDAALQKVADEINRILNPPPANVVQIQREGDLSKRRR